MRYFLSIIFIVTLTLADPRLISDFSKHTPAELCIICEKARWKDPRREYELLHSATKEQGGLAAEN